MIMIFLATVMMHHLDFLFQRQFHVDFWQRTLMRLLRPLSAEPVFLCPSDDVEGSGAAKDI